MKTRFGASLLLASSLSALPLFAQAESPASSEDAEPLGPIVVTATRTPLAKKDVASSVTVISREDIENSGKARVAEVLRDVPGLTLIQTGGPGQQSSVFMRGTESNHILVMIDGVELNDPSVPGGQMDFADLVLDNVERIEVVRGPQSTLYGSDAIGGVINIITRTDDGANYHLEIGEMASVNTGASLRRSMGDHSFGLSANVLDTEGSSAATPSATVHDEKDAYRNITASVRWATKISEFLDFEFRTRLQNSESEIDEFGFTQVAHDPDSTSETDQLFSSVALKWQAPNGKWSQRVSYSISDHKRHRENGPAGANAFASESDFEGDKKKLDWQHNYQLNAANLLTFGAELEDESAKSAGYSESVRNNALYLQDHFTLNEYFSTTLGGRYDKHGEFGSETTWRVAPLLNFEAHQLKFKASYGTGFKAPSLSELYDNSFGLANPDLQPERSEGWDVGFEKHFGPAFIEVIYFRNDIEDLITFQFDPVTFAGSVDNVESAETSGYEVAFGWQALRTLNIRSAYTRTKAENLDTNQNLLRRPENEYSLHINWQAMPRLRLGLNGHYVGRRDDFVGFTVGNMQSHQVVDFSASYDINAQWTATLRVDNLADETYEETFGYQGLPRAAYLGIRWQSE